VRRRRRPATCGLLAGALVALSSPGGSSTAPPLRIGTSGDYAPFSFASETAPGGFDGFDVALARGFAQAEGRPLELVRFRWPELDDALREGRFDVAMSGVTVRADRSLVGRFSLPVAESGAVALVRDGGRFPDLAALAQARAHIVVNAGGYLERVARERFPSAHVEALSDNAQVRSALLEGRADAAVSDTLESREWRRGAEQLRVLGPLTRDRKAPLVRADLPELAQHLDLWLFAREADGTLSELRKAWFADPNPAATAAPLAALLAAADERLSLMPLVAEAKRRAGLPIRDEAQEARVLDAAVRAVDEEAARTGRTPRPEPLVRGVFQALIAAARHLESRGLGSPAGEPAPNPPSLDGVLRPAISRITPKIAEALVRLDSLSPGEALRQTVREQLRTPRVADEDVERLAAALSAYLEAGASPALPLAPRRAQALPQASQDGGSEPKEIVPAGCVSCPPFQ
jgi:cyclohexadienyl dehydratase